MKLNSPTRREVLAGMGMAGLGLIAGPAIAVPKVPEYAIKVLAKKPVAYWRLGEATGERASDATGNGHDGVYKQAPILGNPGALRQDPDTSITLDGKGAYVEVADHRDFSQPTSGRGLTIEAWMRPDVLEFEGESADPYIFWIGKGERMQYEWALRFYSKTSTRPNRISGYIFNLDGSLGAGSYFQDKLTAGEWIHVVVCYDPGASDSAGKPGVHIYRDGIHRLGPPSPGALYKNPKWQIRPTHGNAPVRLGTRNLKHFLTGGLDEIAIYPRILTPGEVQENYLASGRGG